jgi:hypothetical protein
MQRLALNSIASLGRKFAFFFAFLLIAAPYYVISQLVPIGRDSGVFLYTGKMINEGLLPYRDSWDHKGPGLYLLNALGLQLGQDGSGVIFLEGLVLSISLIFAFKIWQRIVGTGLALLVALLFVSYYFKTFEGGNLTETWITPLLLLSYSCYLGSRFLGSTIETRLLLNYFFVLAGVSLATAIVTRPNNGAGVAVLTFLVLIQNKERLIFNLTLFMGAFSIVLFPIFIYLERNGLIEFFISQYFSYNLFYSDFSSNSDRVVALVKGVTTITSSAIGLSLLGVLVLNLVLAYSTKKQERGSQSTSYFLSISLVADVIAQSVSGRTYLHYMCIVTAVLVSLLVSFLLPLRQGPGFSLQHTKSVASILLFVALSASVISSFSYFYALKNDNPSSPESPRSQLVQNLISISDSGDRVLIFGAETSLLFLANRKSVSNYSYIYPVTQDFEDSYREYSESVVTSLPKVIIESSDSCGLTYMVCPEGVSKFSEIRTLVAKSYKLQSEMHGVKFWLRIDGE